MICLSVNGGRAGHARACGPSHLRLEAMSFTVCAPASLRCRSCESVMFRTRVAAVRRCRPPKLSILSFSVTAFLSWSVLIRCCFVCFCVCCWMLIRVERHIFLASYYEPHSIFCFWLFLFRIYLLFAVCRLPFVCFGQSLLFSYLFANLSVYVFVVTRRCSVKWSSLSNIELSVVSCDFSVCVSPMNLSMNGMNDDRVSPVTAHCNLCPPIFVFVFSLNPSVTRTLSSVSAPYPRSAHPSVTASLWFFEF